jgi:serine/threonine protein kinase
MVLGGPPNKTLEIWSFGCLVFELVTGRQLFCVGNSDDDILLDFSSVLGPFPDELFRRWKTSSLYFTPEGTLVNCQLGGVRERGEPLPPDEKTMEELFDQAKPDVDEEEGREIKTLVRRILQYDPDQRLSSQKILSDP